MHWPNIDLIAPAFGLPADISARQLARGDIKSLLALLAASHPQLAVGDAAELLTEPFYDNEVALAGEPQSIADRPAFVLLLTSSAGLIACLVLEYEVAEQALFDRLAVVEPGSPTRARSRPAPCGGAHRPGARRERDVRLRRRGQPANVRCAGANRPPAVRHPAKL